MAEIQRVLPCSAQMANTAGYTVSRIYMSLDLQKGELHDDLSIELIKSIQTHTTLDRSGQI